MKSICTAMVFLNDLFEGINIENVLSKRVSMYVERIWHFIYRTYDVNAEKPTHKFADLFQDITQLIGPISISNGKLKHNHIQVYFVLLSRRHYSKSYGKILGYECLMVKSNPILEVVNRIMNGKKTTW